MNIDYREWPPCAALGGVILAYWRVAGDGTLVPSPTILPDAYVETVINLGGAVMLDGLQIRDSQPPRAVVGLLDTAIEMQYPADICMFGIRLHPARASTFLGLPARALVNIVRPLGAVSKALDDRLTRVVEKHQRIDSAESRDAVEAVLLELARTPDQRALVGKQGGGKPVFALATDNCASDFQSMKTRGVTFEGEPQRMPYGTGVALNDLYGNKIYLNEDPH
jgi:hypothetical protein